MPRIFDNIEQRLLATLDGLIAPQSAQPAEDAQFEQVTWLVIAESKA